MTNPVFDFIHETASLAYARALSENTVEAWAAYEAARAGEIEIEEQEWRSDPPNLNDVPWDELQAYRCQPGQYDECTEHPKHSLVIGGQAFYVPDDVLAEYAAGRIDGTEPWEN